MHAKRLHTKSLEDLFFAIGKPTDERSDYDDIECDGHLISCVPRKDTTGVAFLPGSR
jgi:hypothetical protein